MILLDVGNQPPRMKLKYKKINEKIKNITSEYINGNMSLHNFMKCVGFNLNNVS